MSKEKCTRVTRRTDTKSVVSISEDIGALPVEAVSWLRIDACWWTDLHHMTLKCKIGSCMIPNMPINEEFLAVFPKSSLKLLETKYPK